MVETEQISTTRAVIQINGQVAGEAVLLPASPPRYTVPLWFVELRGVTYRAFSLFGLRAKIEAVY